MDGPYTIALSCAFLQKMGRRMKYAELHDVSFWKKRATK